MDPTSTSPENLSRSPPAPDTPTESAHPTRRSRRRGQFLAVGAILVIVVVVLSLLLLGVLPGWHQSSSSSSNLPTAFAYSEAKAQADSAAAGVFGGPWNAVYAVGYVTGNASGGYPGAYPCVVETVPGFQSLTSDRPAPLTGGTWTEGKAPWWFFVYSNATTAVLAVVVSQGLGVALGTKSQTSDACFGNPESLPTTGILNSTTAFSDIAASNSSFFGSHPALNGTMELFWGIAGTMPRSWPIWVASLTTCPILSWSYAPTYQNGSVYHVALNATSGAVVAGSFYGGPWVCSGPTNSQSG